MCGIWRWSSSSIGNRAARLPAMSSSAAQLTEARAEYGWLRAGSQTVQQQALRDFAQAMQ